MQTLAYALVGMLVGILILLWGIGQQVSAYHTVAQLLQREKMCKDGCYLGGKVKKDSLTIHNGTIYFSVQDEHSNRFLPVNYRGSLPGMFAEGRVVLAQGYLHQGQFYAQRILAKHDEYYRPQ